MFKKTIALLLALVMVLSVASACLAENNEITGTLTLAHHRTDLETEVTQLVEDFMAEYPGITINLEFVADYSNIGIRFTGGEAPDLCELGFTLMPKESWADYLLPQDDIVLNFQSADTFVIDGVRYGYPENVDYDCFMYNKQLWAKAGITEMPTTLDELIVDLQKIAELDGVIPLTSQYKTTWAIARWVANYASAFLEGGYYNWASEHDNPFSNETILTILNAVRKMNKLGLLDPDLMSSDWDLQSSDFAAGTIATYCAGTYANGTMVAMDFPQEDIGYFAYPNPDGSGTTATTVGAGYAMVISKDCQYPEAAKLFVEYYYKNFANRTGLVSPILGEVCTINGITEMLETGCKVVTNAQLTDAATAIRNLAAFDVGTFIQAYLIAQDDQTDAVIEKYNTIWNAARAEYQESIAK